MSGRELMSIPIEPTDADLSAVSDVQWDSVASSETFPHARGVWRAIATIYAGSEGATSPTATQAPKDTALRDVRVKPLAWDAKYGYAARAEALWGWYAVFDFGEPVSCGDQFRLDMPVDRDHDYFATLVEAKAFAEADYEARILSALEPSSALIQSNRKRDQAREALKSLRAEIAEGVDYLASIKRTEYGDGSLDAQKRIAARVDAVLSSLPPSPSKEGEQ